jgi:hypothetical protein
LSAEAYVAAKNSSLTAPICPQEDQDSWFQISQRSPKDEIKPIEIFLANVEEFAALPAGNGRLSGK